MTGAPLLRLLPWLRDEWPRALAGAACGALSFAAGVGAAVTGAWLVGRALSASPGSALAEGLPVLAACVSARGVLAWLDSWLAHDAAFRVLARLRLGLVDALRARAFSLPAERRAGDVATAALADVESLEWFFAHTLPACASAIFLTVASLALLAWLDPLLALAALPCLGALASVPAWLARRARRQGAALRAGLAALHADTVESVQGLRELLAFGAGASRAERLDRAGRTLEAARSAHARRASLEEAVEEALGAAALVTLVAVAAARAAQGAWPRHWLPAVVVFALSALAPLRQLVAALRQVGPRRAAAARLLEWLDAPPDVVDHAAHAPVPSLGPGVAFEQVSFRYRPEGPDVLDGLSFEVHQGETVALVGASGAGKTTCTHLLLRLRDPTAGRVTLGGVDLRALPLSALRAQVALVPQDVDLFHGTLRDNLLLARPEATPAELAQAVERARVDEFARLLPQGLDTPLGEGGRLLSGGQRQRLAIARALLRDARVLVLDEAAAGLDAENEEALRRALDAARATRATLVIAHREATLRAADRVLVLEGGRVVQAGPHAELAARDGPYRRLLAAGLKPSGD